LHTVIATALLAGTFTVVDQVSDQKVANAAETTGQAGELVFTTDSAENRSPNLLTIGSNGNYYTTHSAGIAVYNSSGARLRTFNPGWTGAKAITAGAVTASKTKVIFYGADQVHVSRGILFFGEEATAGNASKFSVNKMQNQMVFAPTSDMLFTADSDNFLRRFGVANRVDGGVHASEIALGGAADELRIQVVGATEYVLAAGAFGLKRYLATTGAEDTSFTKYTAGALTALAVDPVDKSILVGNGTNVYRLPAAGASALGTALMSTNVSTTTLAVDSKSNFYRGSTNGIQRFTSTGSPDAVFNANSNTGTAFNASQIVRGNDNRIGAIQTSGSANTPQHFRLYRGDSPPPDAPTLSSVVPNHQGVTATVARTGTKVASSYRIYTVQDTSKFCLVTGTAPASGNTSSTGGSCSITGLTNGTAYTFKAIAYNVEDASVDSIVSSSVTPVRMAPTLTSVTNTAAGNTIVLTYDSPLSQTPPLTSSMFTVREAGSVKTINSVAVSEIQ
jgi:hypothetical protein